MHYSRNLTLMRRAGLLLALAASAAALAAESPIRLDAERLKTAGVQFTPATAPDAAAGASISLSGTVTVPSSDLEMVLAPIEGRVEAVLVNPGQKVRAGQGLVTLYSAELLSMQRALVTARAQEAAAAARAARDEQLHSEGIIARNRLEETRAALVESQAALHEQTQLARLAGLSTTAVDNLKSAEDISPRVTLTARRAGHVLAQLASPGEAISTGTPLLRLARLDSLWIELQATRDQALQIRTGDNATVRGCSGSGKVIATSLQMGETSQTVAIRIEIAQPASCVAPNQFVEARITPRADTAGLVQVPAASVVRNQGRDYVFARMPEGVVAREVQVERRTTSTAWIRGPVQAGDAIASAGIAALKGSWLGFGATESQ